MTLICPLTLGAIAVPGGIFGNIIAGVVVKKYDMRARAALQYCIACCAIVVCMSPIALLYCEETQVSGVNIPYKYVTLLLIHLSL